MKRGEKVALAIVLALALAGYALIWAQTSPANTHHRAKCVEDAPCWNWATMGNHRRGIITMWGTPEVVSPCRYQHLAKRGLIAPGDHMLGDKTAWHARCA